MNEKMAALRKCSFWGDNVLYTGFVRTGYAERMEKPAGTCPVKVLAGPRRAGKSFLLRQLARRLMESGVPYIVATGRKGGSNIAACICNALLYMLSSDRGY